MAIIEELREIIVEQMGCDPASITEDTNITDDIGCDSLDMVEMLMNVENKYGFEFDGCKKEWTLGTPVTIVRMVMKRE